MPPLPPLNLNFTSDSSSRANNSMAGATSQWGNGAWNVNVGGSGQANFAANASAGASGNSFPWLALVAVGAVVLLLK